MLPAYLTVDTYTHAVLYVHVCAYCSPPAALVAALRTDALYDRAGEWEEESEQRTEEGQGEHGDITFARAVRTEWRYCSLHVSA